MTEANFPPDAAKQPGAVDETMPDPAAAAGESAPDSQGEHELSEAAPAAAAMQADLQAAPHAPQVGNGTDISVASYPEKPAPDSDPAASTDPEHMVADPTGLGGVGGEGGAG